MRKNCYQSKKDNPNWLDKMEVELSERFIKDQVSVIMAGSPTMIKFKDSEIISNDKILSYSCEVINK